MFGNFVLLISQNLLIDCSIWIPRCLGCLATFLFGVILMYKFHFPH